MRGYTTVDAINGVSLFGLNETNGTRKKRDENLKLSRLERFSHERQK